MLPCRAWPRSPRRLRLRVEQRVEGGTHVVGCDPRRAFGVSGADRRQELPMLSVHGPHPTAAPKRMLRRDEKTVPDRIEGGRADGTPRQRVDRLVKGPIANDGPREVAGLRGALRL